MPSAALLNACVACCDTMSGESSVYGVQWTSVGPGGLRILSFTLRPDNMDGAESYESSTVFGPLAGIVAISL